MAVIIPQLQLPEAAEEEALEEFLPAQLPRPVRDPHLWEEPAEEEELPIHRLQEIMAMEEEAAEEDMGQPAEEEYP